MNLNNNEKKAQSIFYIDLDKIKPNPYQPRVHFNEEKLTGLSESIKQYGVLQPIIVSRKEIYKEGVGISAEYEILAGERRFRAAKWAGLTQIPALIREGEHTDKEKLELAIIENLQREDLNPVDKARAFKKLAEEFNLKHEEIALKMGKSREFITNSLRILNLPLMIQDALMAGRISEGHSRPLLSLKDKPNEQELLFKKIIAEKLTVRVAENIARSHKENKKIKETRKTNPEIKAVETSLSEKLGTKVSIEQKESSSSGKITIEFFSKEDLNAILKAVDKSMEEKKVLVNNFSEVKNEETFFQENKNNGGTDNVNLKEDNQNNFEEEKEKKIEKEERKNSADSETMSLYNAFLKSKEKAENSSQEIKEVVHKDNSKIDSVNSSLKNPLTVKENNIESFEIKNNVSQSKNENNLEKENNTTKEKDINNFQNDNVNLNISKKPEKLNPIASGPDFLSAKNEFKNQKNNTEEEKLLEKNKSPEQVKNETIDENEIIKDNQYNKNEERSNEDFPYGFKGFSV